MADIGASNWSETDANNSSAAPDGAPENMAAAGINDTMRAMMGATKRFYDWSIPKATAGSSTVYTLTYGVAPGALLDGMTHRVVFHAANGASPTLNINGLGAVPLHIFGASGAWVAVPAGALNNGTVVTLSYNTAAGTYRIQNLQSTGNWTPTDGSGAGVALTGVSANYQIHGNMCFAYFLFTYSANGSAAGAAITLPVACAGSNYGGPATPLDIHGGTAPAYIRPLLGTGVASFFSPTSGIQITNTSLGGITVSGVVIYPIS